MTILAYILICMTNLIDSLVLTLQVLAKIAFNFSPVLLLVLAFVGVMKLIETK